MRAREHLLSAFRTLCVAALAIWPLRAPAADLTIFAAASTGTALAEIVELWEAETGHTATLSLAGTSALARQIAAGAPADVFLSASADWMDRLDAAGRIVSGTRTNLLGNALVLIGPAEAPPVDLSHPGELPERLGAGPLAMALVDAVPAGIYGKAALETIGVWPEVASRVAQTDNVRAALALVAVGAAPMGIVYATDARADARVSVLARVPDRTHPPIVYPVAAVAGGEAALTAAFLAYLRGPDAQSAFRAQGFLVAGG